MSEHRITVAGGSSVRLPTGGKYCDRDIIVTAEGGGTELPTLNNPAAETDVVKGKEYIDSAGVKKTGTVEEVNGELYDVAGVDLVNDGENACSIAIPEEDVLLRAYTPVRTVFTANSFGDATPADVAAGKTFSSKDGFFQTGTRKPQALPTLNNPASENDVALGKEYIGADGEKRYGQLHMDGVWTPDWSTYVPVHIGYDSDDRFLVMDNLDGVGGGGLETVEIAMCDYMDRGLYVYYTDGNGRIQQTNLPSYDITIEVAKYTIVCIEGYSDDIYPVDTGGEYSPVGNTWNVRKLTFTFGTNGYIRIATA